MVQKDEERWSFRWTLALRRLWGLRIARLLLTACFLIAPATAQVGLPRLAVSVPPASPGPDIAASIRSVNGCQVPGAPTVLPGIVIQLGGEPPATGSLKAQAKALSDMPADSEAWLRVQVGSGALTENESEVQITSQVDALVKALPLSAAAVHGMIIEPAAPGRAPDLFAFGLLRLAVSAKSANSNLRLAFVFGPGFIEAHPDLVRRLASYADLLGTGLSKDWEAESQWIAEHALNKPLILKLDEPASASSHLYIAAAMAASGTSVEILWSNPPDAPAAGRTCSINRSLTRSISAGMLRMDPTALPFTVTVDGQKSADARWFGSGQSSDLVLLVPVNAVPGQQRSVTLQATGKPQYELQWYDPVTGERRTACPARHDEGGPNLSCSWTDDYSLLEIHRKSEGQGTVFNQVEVKGGMALTMEEIIARWQTSREAQNQRLDNYQAYSFMNLHFQSTTVASAFDISMRLRQFYGRSKPMEYQQVEFYVNGVKFSNKHEFPLPQLEPEKVLTQPLELKRNDPYDYKLLGTEQINGALCYVVGVEPRLRSETLYSGKIWIDGTTFREVRQILSQRSDRTNVVVNVETENFALYDDGKGNRFNLPRSVSAQQTLNAAGRDFQLQRTVQFSDYTFNTPQFDTDVAAAHESDNPMYSETDQGLRELKKKGTERFVDEKTGKRIRSLVGGAMYEGTFNFPIPFAGFSFADFDYRHTGSQLSLFFAWPILATNISRQYGPQLRLGSDVALSAIPGEYRVFNGSVEDKAQGVWNWEETVGSRATWQLGSHTSFTFFTYLNSDIYRATSDTAKTYQLPRNGITFLPGAQLRFTDKGYILTADVTRGQRIAWKSFGYPEAPAPAEDGYNLYDADFNKDYYIKKFTKGGWDFSYFGGNQLDRFSRYFPSFFSSPRIHGIPGGTDSFDAIAMANAHYGFNVMDLIKFEGMYSYARARNLAESSQFKKYDGVELNFNTAGPKGTLIQGTVSYALDGNIARYNSRWGVMVMVFKPLK